MGSLKRLLIAPTYLIGARNQTSGSRSFLLLSFLDKLPKTAENFIMDVQNINENYSTTWIENLAMDEINMEESGVINFSEHLDPLHMLETSSLEFMEKIKERFEVYLSKFNELRAQSDDQTRTIKMFKISNTVNDFMLFRNGLKLVVARRSADVISLGFLSNSGGLFAARLNYQPNSERKIHEIKAHVGPFNNIHWKFNGENVDVDSLVRHYLTEFIKHSAR